MPRRLKIRSQAIHPLIRLFSTTILPLIPVIFCSDETAYTPGNTYASNDPLYARIYPVCARVPRKRRRYTATKEIHAQEINFRPWR